MPNCNPIPSKNNKIQAMQRLATQKEPIPGVLTTGAPTIPLSTSVKGFSSGIYPKLPEVSLNSRPSQATQQNLVSSAAVKNTFTSTASGTISTTTADVTSIMPSGSLLSKSYFQKVKT